jgi:hypothetical protein
VREILLVLVEVEKLQHILVTVVEARKLDESARGRAFILSVGLRRFREAPPAGPLGA